MMNYQQAPELATDRWYNTDQSLSLAQLRGRVVAIEAFQMLCPGCVAHGIPQVQRVAETFPESEVVVLGLHTVFEHHAAMPPVSLEVFLHEYRVAFPVAVDRPNGDGVPVTMGRYGMRGTPTLLLLDARGRLRQHWFGRMDDMRVGAEIMRLVDEMKADARLNEPRATGAAAGNCDDGACAL